jgi:RNA-directed DNA polymerase
MITVPFSATPIKEPPDIRTMASIVVWTDRMLTTLLENKVRGGKWHSLYDKVWNPRNLLVSAEKVVDKHGAGGVDHQTVEKFSERFQEEIDKLQQELKDESYRPLPSRRVGIQKTGSKEIRPLGIPAVRDRVVQTALLNVIAPIFEHTFHDRSFGFRRGRGTRNALQCVEQLLNAGNVFVVDVDLKSYFDTIPKDKLFEIVKTKISDGALLRLIRKYLDQSVMSELATWTPETGVPQGAVLSPLLANAYLNPLDHLMAESGFEMVRYADDMVVLCRTLEEAQQVMQILQDWTTKAGLALHPIKTRIVDFRVKSFDFLGYSFRGRFRFPRDKNNKRLKDKIRELTKRSDGNSLESIVNRLNPMLQGWFNYFRHCFWNIFDDYDSYLRKRLRAIQVKRHRRNPKRLSRTQRWPNAFFFELGLFSLREAHTRIVQSTQGY